MITKSYGYIVLFEEGSAEILERETKGIAQGIWRWPRMPDHRVRVAGYADAEREMEGVSLLRAEAVFRYLVEHGVEATRIDALAACNEPPPETPDLRRMLRKVRVEFYNPHFGTPNWGA